MRLRDSILGAVGVNILLCSICMGFEDEGFQWWTYAEAVDPDAEDWKAAFRQTCAGRRRREFYYEHSDLIFTYSGLAKWLDVAGGYRLVYQKTMKMCGVVRIGLFWILY